jgi:hypothetical protein
MTVRIFAEVILDDTGRRRIVRIDRRDDAGEVDEHDQVDDELDGFDFVPEIEYYAGTECGLPRWSNDPAMAAPFAPSPGGDDELAKRIAWLRRIDK